MKMKRNGNQNFIKILLCLMFAGLLFVGSAQKAFATGWVDKSSDVYEKLYGAPDSDADIGGTATEGKEPGIVEEFFSNLVVSLATGINNLLSSQDIDLSLDGIVCGRMSHSMGNGGYVKADFTHFGLEENNPWGIIGATIFYSLRSICLVLMPVTLLALLMVQLFHNTPKGRARLKELASHTVFVFALMFVLPYVLDLFIYFRDIVLYAVSQGLRAISAGISGSVDVENGVGAGLIDMMIAEQDGSLLYALILLASVAAGVFFFVDYIRIALLLTIAFGIFPLIALMSFGNTKKLSDWSNVFFPNLLVPFIDMMLVLVPSILNALFVRILGYGGITTILVGLIMVVVVWNAVVIRNRIIKLLGFDGIGGGAGLGQMLNTLAHAIPHGSRGEKLGKGETSEKETARENREKAERATQIGQEMDSAVDDMVKSDSLELFSRHTETSMETDKLLDSMETDAETVNKNVGLTKQAQDVSEETLEPQKEEMPSSADELPKIERGESANDVKEQSGVLRYDTFMEPAFVNETLAGRDRDVLRYENLARRDALREAISNNEEIMRKAGYDRDTYVEDYAVLTEEKTKYTDSYEEFKRKKESLEAEGIQNGAEYDDVNTGMIEARTQRDLADRKRKELEAAKQADAMNVTYHAAYEQCDRNERRFAEINGYGDSSTRVYDSAAAYKHQERINAIRREKADYKNFDSKQYKGLFTPEEEAKYRMERDQNRHKDAAIAAGKKAVRGAANIAVGGALAVGGVFAAGYGGTTASIGAGIVGARSGVKVVDGIIQMPDAVAQATSIARGSAQLGAEVAKASVMSAYKRDHKLFTGQGSAAPRADPFIDVQNKAQAYARQGEMEAGERRARIDSQIEDIYRAASERASE